LNRTDQSSLMHQHPSQTSMSVINEEAKFQLQQIKQLQQLQSLQKMQNYLNHNPTNHNSLDMSDYEYNQMMYNNHPGIYNQSIQHFPYPVRIYSQHEKLNNN
jgi:hypothetical protein